MPLTIRKARDTPDQFAYWHIASFRCAAEFGCYRGIADIDKAASIYLEL
jgi:hypothetical protein